MVPLNWVCKTLIKFQFQIFFGDVWENLILETFHELPLLLFIHQNDVRTTLTKELDRAHYANSLYSPPAVSPLSAMTHFSFP